MAAVQAALPAEVRRLLVLVPLARRAYDYHRWARDSAAQLQRAKLAALFRPAFHLPERR